MDLTDFLNAQIKQGLCSDRQKLSHLSMVTNISIAWSALSTINEQKAR